MYRSDLKDFNYKFIRAMAYGERGFKERITKWNG